MVEVEVDQEVHTVAFELREDQLGFLPLLRYDGD